MSAAAARYRLIALHGFLGRAADWDPLRRVLAGASLETVDLWRVLDNPAVRDWESLGAVLDQVVRALTREAPSLPAFLVAYSFGARLALSIPDPGRAPSAVDGVCLISCHPGLAADDATARDARRASDAAWERKILEEPEADVLRQWDAQAVLAGGRFERRESRFPARRDLLARAMQTFSLAGQPDFRRRLRSWSTPLLWVTGARDRKFSAIARELGAAGLRGDLIVCEGAGHRVPWDAPEAFSRTLVSWIDRQMSVGAPHESAD